MKQKKYLRNNNGINYEIIAQRKSTYHKSNGNFRNDYLVKTPKGEMIIAIAWNPDYKSWARGKYYGKYTALAKKDFLKK